MDDMPQYTGGVRRSSADLAHQEQPRCGSVEKMNVCESESVCVLFSAFAGWVVL